MKIKKLFLLSAGVLSSILPAASIMNAAFAETKAEDVNILTNQLSNYNPSFETGDSKDTIYWWNDNNWSQGAVKRVAYKEGEAADGDCGACYALVQSKDNNSAIIQVCSTAIAGLITGGTKYTYTYYAKLADGVKSGSVALTIKGFKSDWSACSEVTGTETTPVTLNNNWQKVTGTFTLEDAKDQVMVQFVGSEGTTYCVDDLRVCPSAQLGALSIDKDLPSVKSYMASDKGLGRDAIVGTAITTGELTDSLYFELSTKHFNAITIGNELKPDCMNAYHNGNKDYIALTQDKLNGKTITVPVLDYTRADNILDKIVEYNKANPNNKIKVRGHVLVWHSQTPEWWFHKDYDATKEYVGKDEMNVRLEWYIKTMMDHYTNKSTATGKKYSDLFYAWDVVNEACTDNGLRTDVENGGDKLSDYTHGNKSSWYHVYKSNEFIINAFKFANKYAPKTLDLYYNDYGECSPKKRDAICKLLKDIKAAPGTRISGMGMQGHYDMTNPTVSQIESAVKAYCAIVGKVMWTELDLNGVKDDADGAYRYKEIYDTLLALNKQKGIKVAGITFWGTMDKYSWLQSSSSVGGGADGKSRQNPLLFDDYYQAKKMYYAFTDQSKLPPAKEKVVINKDPIEAAAGTPVLGTTVSAEWNKAKSYDLKLSNGAKATGNVKVMWDKDNLYVLFTVKDDVLNKDNANAWEQDSIEVFIDEDNGKQDEYLKDDKQYRISYEDFHSFNGTQCTEQNMKSVVTKTSDGYVVQCAFKWTDVKPAAGMEVGIDFQINDADASGKRIGTVNLFDPTGNGWQWPSVFGSVILK